MKPWLLDGVRLYFECALLLGAATAVIAALVAWPGVASRGLRNARLALYAALFLPLIMALVPSRGLLPPKAQVWSGKQSATGGYALVATALGPESLPNPVVEGWKVSDRALGILGALILAGALAALARLAMRYARLGAYLRRQKRVHRLGRVDVLRGPVAVAFSARHRGRAYVMLPEGLSADDARMTLAHELQHHRQGDTLLCLVLEWVRALFFWNPAVYCLCRWLEQLQEFACDEVLIGRRRFSSRAYGRCLLQAAQTALGSRRCPVGTTGMAATSAGHFLKRRITMILNPTQSSSRGRLFAVGTVAVMAALSFAAHSAVQYRKLSSEQALQAAQSAALGSLVPIDMNALVEESLNRYTSTPEGRKHAKGALERLPRYRAMIEKKILEYGLPPELIALPMYESGFRNDVISSAKAVGIWQFIPQTARRYGLKASDKREEMVEGKDERLNPELETDAAMRYLSDLHAQFKDWRLAIKAYNEGENRVAAMIQSQGSRDPWALEKASSTENYLSGAIATMILYKNQKLLN